MFAWYSRDLPRPGQVVRKDGFSTKLYDRTGALLYDLYADQRRDPVTMDKIPEYLKWATISVEDKDFYKHQGFDPLTPLRMGYNFIFRGGRVVGGSTLTQQLVKNVLLTNERSFGRKFKELVLSIQIERSFTKDQILEMYINEAPYGGTAWGVGTASRLYFDKPVQELNLVESAILAGLPQRPTAYSPYGGKTDTDGTPLWKVRTLGVLRRMIEDQHISKIEYDQAVTDLESVQFKRQANDILAPHFVYYVRDQLISLLGDEDLVLKGGLTVTTSLDLNLHNATQQIVTDEIAKVSESFHITNGAAVVVNPQTGEILSMVGSADYNNDEIGGKFNVVANDDLGRQPGSSIKPVTYLMMLRKGYTPASVLADVPTIFAPNDSAKKYEPKNYNGKFNGLVNLRTSLASSLNIPAVKSLAIVGLPDFLQQAQDMGFESLAPTPENMSRFGLAVTLGGAEVHPIDTATAYSAFANGGTKVEPVSILKVEDRNGKVLYEHHNVTGRRVMSPEEAYLINNMLSDNAARSLAFGANSLLNTGRAIAVKTGTTNDRKDNWTVGWSQSAMVTVWVGNNDNSEMKQVASGVTGASPIWRKIMNALLENGYKASDWVMPEGIEKVELDSISGFAKHDDFPSYEEVVIKGTVPAPPDPIHRKIKLCRGENKLATDARVNAGDYDEKEYVVIQENDPFSQDGMNRWQDAINAWVTGQDEKYRPPTEYCGSSSDVSVRMSKPENERKYDSEDIDIEVDADSGDGIDKIEIWVDGSVRETVNNRSYRGRIRIGSGQHEVWAKAFSRGGKDATTGKAKIGTGGQDWKKADPTPTPTPTPATPTPTPTPAPTPTPPPSILPSPSTGI